MIHKIDRGKKKRLTVCVRIPRSSMVWVVHIVTFVSRGSHAASFVYQHIVYYVGWVCFFLVTVQLTWWNAALNCWRFSTVGGSAVEILAVQFNLVECVSYVWRFKTVSAEV